MLVLTDASAGLGSETEGILRPCLGGGTVTGVRSGSPGKIWSTDEENGVHFSTGTSDATAAFGS